MSLKTIFLYELELIFETICWCEPIAAFRQGVMWAVGSFDLVVPFSFVGHLCCVNWIDHLGDLGQSHSIPVLH